MKKRTHRLARGVALSLAVFAALLWAAVALVGRIDSASQAAETQLVRDAVRSAALTCYAVEGAYPLSLDYLKERYGLHYNEDVYIVAYDAFASNVMPDIRVLKKGAV